MTCVARMAILATRFDAFWAEMAKYFNEITCAAQERRHGTELYLPFAISVEDLVETISSHVPEGTPIPTNEWVRLQFWPKGPTTARVLNYSGRFEIKFTVQTRQIRGSHDDVLFCQFQLRLVKHFAVRFKDNASMLCLDYKAVIIVGEPS